MKQPKVISVEQALKEIRAMHPEVADLMEKNLSNPESGTIASEPNEVVDDINGRDAPAVYYSWKVSILPEQDIVAVAIGQHNFLGPGIEGGFFLNEKYYLAHNGEVLFFEGVLFDPESEVVDINVQLDFVRAAILYYLG